MRPRLVISLLVSGLVLAAHGRAARADQVTESTKVLWRRGGIGEVGEGAMKRLLVLCLAALTASCATTIKAHALTAVEVGKKLDLNSFPNSTGPRRDPDKHTPQQYGFIAITGKASTATFARPDGGWEIDLEILSRSPGQIQVRFEDLAGGNNGPGRDYGDYHAEDTLDLTLGGDGLYRASGERAVGE